MEIDKDKETRARSGDGLSLEEEDLRERSIKKPKGASLDDSPVDDSMQEKNQEGETVILPASQQPPLNFKAAVLGAGCRVVSYKDKLLVLNGDGNLSNSEDEDWMTIQRKEEEDEEEVPFKMGNQGLEEDPLCPTYHYSKADHKEDCKKWRTALIVKLLGRKISSRFLVARTA